MCAHRRVAKNVLTVQIGGPPEIESTSLLDSSLGPYLLLLSTQMPKWTILVGTTIRATVITAASSTKAVAETIRPTKDIDLLGFGDTSADALKLVFVSLCGVEAPEDGLTFLPESVHVEAIREGQEYGGMRVKLVAMLGNVRISLQVDVGAGDAVVPPPEVLDYPSLLDLPRARIRAYRPETSIAEKTEAMVSRGVANSRMKDFFDIYGLGETRTFDGDTMRAALAATLRVGGRLFPLNALWH